MALCLRPGERGRGTASRAPRGERLSTAEREPGSAPLATLRTPWTPVPAEPRPPARATETVPELRVDVVDAAGRPASGVPLACGLDSAPFVPRLRVHTDADGRARFPLDELEPDAALRVRAEVLTETACESAVRGEGPVLLRLPPTGSVRMQATDAEGRPLSAAVRFGLWARGAGARSDLEPLPRWISAPHGAARLEHVGLGLELRIALEHSDGGGPAERLTIQGPATLGEERTVSVPLAAPWPTARARLLDERGAVLGNQSVEVELRGTPPDVAAPPTTRRSRSFRTDAEGIVRFPLAGNGARRLATARLALRQEETDTHPARAGERELSWDLVPGASIDLGDIALHTVESVVWLTGHVLDPVGNPVPEARVLASAEGASGPSAQADAGSDGAFTLAGEPVAGPLSVRAVAPGFLPSRTELVPAGRGELGIRLQPAARWRGRLLLDPDVSAGDLALVMITATERRRVIPRTEQVVVDGLSPGRIDVEVRTRVGDWLVERHEHLDVPSGGSGDGPETPLDLRARLMPLRLRLLEPDGTELDRVLARIRPDPWPVAEVWIHAGRLELLVPRDARTIALVPSGHEALVLDPLPGTQAISCAPRVP